MKITSIQTLDDHAQNDHDFHTRGGASLCEEEMGAKRDALYMKHVETGEIDLEIFKAFEDFSFAEARSEKYLPWMVREYLAHSGTREEIIDMIRWFNRNYRRFHGIDIYSQTWDQLVNLRDEHGMSGREREKNREAKRSQVAILAEYQNLDKHDPKRNAFPARLPNLNLLVDTDKFKIGRIRTFNDAVIYNGVRDLDKYKAGKGESWCIGRGSLAGKEEWAEQTSKAVFFYGWWNAPGETLERACIQVFPGTQIRVWDRNDDPYELERTPYGQFKDLFEADRPQILEAVQKRLLNYPHTRNSSGGLVLNTSLILRHYGLRSFSELGLQIDEIQGSLSIDYNYLHDFEGFPEKIRGDLNVSFNYLESLNGIPTEIGGSLKISSQRNGHRFDEDDIRKVTNVKRFIEI